MIRDEQHNHFRETAVINAAGKLTALGGSAQSDSVANAAAAAATMHVDLAAMRREAGAIIARLTGGQAGCITTGAAAGITISCAAILCAENPDWLRLLPQLPSPRYVLLQAGHAINFGADIEQMIRLSGATPCVAGSLESVTRSDLLDALASNPAISALLYVKSHHCVQENRVDLDEMIRIARQYQKPVIVDAAAEEDLTRYVNYGADLVTYSGGKAFCGPTSGFITGRNDLVTLCEDQFRGIARTMKVGKEQIAGLIAAMQEFVDADEVAHQARLRKMNQQLLDALRKSRIFKTYLKPDEAGRNFARVALTPATLSSAALSSTKLAQSTSSRPALNQPTGKPSYDTADLIRYLENGSPGIRTRNHQAKNNIVLLDVRELNDQQIDIIIERLAKFEATIGNTAETTKPRAS